MKSYFDVIYIDSSDNGFLLFIKKISNKIEKNRKSKVLKPLYERLHKRFINNKLINYKNIPVLEIAENVEVNNDFYLFRDMSYVCYSYVLDKFKNDNNNYGHGMLKHLSKDALDQRILNEERLINKSKCTFIMGQWVTKLLKDKYPENSNKFVAVGGGFSNDFITENNNKNYNKKILFVGKDHLRKGGDILEKAFCILKEKYDKDAELIIAGSNINNHIDGVTYLGNISKEQLSKYFNESTIFCMPSRFEAFGLVFIEALCYGLPIVSIDDYEMHYFIKDGDNGYLIKKYDADELAQTLHKALNNKEMLANVCDSKKQFRKDYTWDAVAKKVANIINERSYSNGE